MSKQDSTSRSVGWRIIHFNRNSIFKDKLSDIFELFINRKYDFREEKVGKYDEIHVMPFDDAEIHPYSHFCTCQPTVEETYRTKLVIHNSFDGREAVEQARQILEESTG